MTAWRRAAQCAGKGAGRRTRTDIWLQHAARVLIESLAIWAAVGIVWLIIWAVTR